MKLTIWWSWVHSTKTWVHELITYPWTPLPHIAFKNASWTSLVLQWLTIHLPMQETWVLSLLQEDSICCGAPKPMLHNYWAYALEPTVQFSSVIQSCLTLFDPVDSSTPGFPVHHQLPELAQTQWKSLPLLFHIWLLPFTFLDWAYVFIIFLAGTCWTLQFHGQERIRAHGYWKLICLFSFAFFHDCIYCLILIYK